MNSLLSQHDLDKALEYGSKGTNDVYTQQQLTNRNIYNIQHLKDH